MILFIKNFELENIKHKLMILYIFNVTDIIFTHLLLATGFYLEANFLMTKAVQSLFSSFILKIALPATLLFYIYTRMKKANEKQLKQSNIIVNIATAIYSLINIFHLFCFLQFGFFKVFVM